MSETEKYWTTAKREWLKVFFISNTALGEARSLDTGSVKKLHFFGSEYEFSVVG